MFAAKHEIITPGKAHKYHLTRHGDPVSYAEALNLWQHDEPFRSQFLTLLSESPFSAYRFETPPITKENVDRDFEFVLLNSPGLARASDPKTYSKFFTTDDTHEGIVTFENLGKDAILIVPSPRTSDSAYVHLAAFIRGAPESQKHALLRVVGNTAKQILTERALWISTAGGGVAWLHLRLDSHPKYYGYAPYKARG